MSVAETWEEYRAAHIRSLLSIIDESTGWRPSEAQINWLKKYATKTERAEFAARGVSF